MKNKKVFTKPSRGMNEVVPEARQNRGSWSNSSRHPEFISGLCNSGGGQILNRVQDDKIVKELADLHSAELKCPVDILVRGDGAKRVRIARKLSVLQRSCISETFRALSKSKTPSCPPVFRTSSKRVAFTLAEVLITLAIIGVVAAMTIPTLISKYQEKQAVSALKKVYSTLSQAFMMMETEQGFTNEWGSFRATNTGETDEEGNPVYDLEAQKLIGERLKSYLKVMSTSKEDEVFDSRPLYSLSGVKVYDNFKTSKGLSDESLFKLQDGTLISLGNFNVDSRGRNICIRVFLPHAKKLVWGKQGFVFYYNFTNHKLEPEGTTHMKFDKYCKRTLDTELAGRGCTAWVLQYENMDYLHCDDLVWGQKTKCD